jgi:N-acetylglucosaminyl-diphospho-decaprenol L-rhamnosyltransferase
MRVAFEQVRGFDDAYFMYVEEVDLCWRLRQAGWSIVHEPRARVVHIGGASAGRRPYAMVLAHHRSLWRFSVRTTAGSDRLLLPLAAVGILSRSVLALARVAMLRWVNRYRGRIRASALRSQISQHR